MEKRTDKRGWLKFRLQHNLLLYAKSYAEGRAGYKELLMLVLDFKVNSWLKSILAE